LGSSDAAIMRVLAVPGFGDTAGYWSGSLADALGCAVATIEWPGLWGAAPCPRPIDTVISKIVASVDERTVLVGHSLGCRVLLSRLHRIRPRSVVLTAPALGPLSIMSADSVAAWRLVGTRPTRRPDPHTGHPVTLEIPYSFAEGIALLPAPSPIPAQVATVLLSADVKHNPAARLLAVGPVVEVRGPHRWWEEDGSRSAVLQEIARRA